ncbi:tyrosine/phenylalanine carboxypeptidase domain-containing protein [Patescibacteria group bacterium]
MSIFTRAKGILGINARNLLYVARLNSRAAKRFADNKIYTKQFLSSRSIGVAKIYTVIRTHQELRRFQISSLPPSFVIKPNHGYGGEGIIIISGRKKDIFYGVGDDRWEWKDLFQHMVAILDGKYAISGLRDEIVIEERLLPHDYFRKYAEMGLPDIRVIVFNLVPTLAMLRLPSAESKGKANLHLGAIGLGIDLGTGRATFGVRHNKFITKLPNGDRINTIQLPDWDEVLLTASKCQKYSGIGYLAVDLTLTNKGVKVVELNARAGLSAQIANRVFLRSRLEKVADLKIITPEQGIEIAKTLFSFKTARPQQTSSGKPVLGLYELVRLLNTDRESVIAKIDPHSDVTLLDESIQLEKGEKLLDIKIKDQKIKVPVKSSVLPREKYQVVIAGKHLKGFLIDIASEQPVGAHAQILTGRNEKILQNVDRKLTEISSSIHFLALVKPQNLERIKELFLKHPTSSPQFSYKPLDIDIHLLRRELKKMHKTFHHPLAELMLRKIDELEIRLNLIEARGTKKMMNSSIQLYGDVAENEFTEAHNLVVKGNVEKDTSEKISVPNVVKQLQDYLAQHNLSNWKVIIQEEATTDMQVNKRGTVFVRKKAQITSNRLKSLIVHEIETHVFRHENGKRQPYRIFEQGTAGYLETEEGLAIFNQEQLGIPLGEKKLWSALNVIGIWHGKHMGFLDLFHHLLKTYPINRDTAWRVCVKVKRGLHDTDEHAAFTKDRVYFSGYKKVKSLYDDQGLGGIRQLYIGKIGIDDLDILTPLGPWNVKLLPSFFT